MPRTYTDRDIIRALKALGFARLRQKGSHATYSNGSRRVGVPIHKGRTLKRGTLQGILNQAGISEAELEALV